ncbi:methyltransferase domain-containing protein [Methylobacterium sp. JK268]
MERHYVHGYDSSEGTRLLDQARVLDDLIHEGITFPKGSTVLEAGCGVGAQTVILSQRHPGIRLTCIDRSEASLAQASAAMASAGLKQPVFRRADLLRDLPFRDAAFDHVFVCFVLEHLADPVRALRELRRVLKPGGTITVVEGDHDSALLHPDDVAAGDVVRCLIDLQRSGGGDARIGRRLHPLLREAGYAEIRVAPRPAYHDASRPEAADAFVRQTFTAMVAGTRLAATQAGLIDDARFAAGIQALLRTADDGGTFCYTFFRAFGRKP